MAKVSESTPTATEDSNGAQVERQPSSPSPPAQEAPQSGGVLQHVLTDNEAQLLHLLQTEDGQWPKAEVVDDYALMQDPFELPPECKKMEAEKKWRYRWLDPYSPNFKMSTNKASPIHWRLCNRMSAPEIPDRYFDVSGGVRNMGLVLSKMPWWMFERRLDLVHRRARPAERKGPANADGMEFTGQDGGKFKGGDIIVAEEKDGGFDMKQKVYSSSQDADRAE